MPYDPTAIETRWQDKWISERTFRAEIDPEKPKYYVLDMFPYPSGEGLHVGHPKGYISTDAIARYKRLRGFSVLHPMGWDAFGLPAEQYAVKTGTHPRITTERNINNYRRQLKQLGLSYDWHREVDTTEPDYVKWTQWIFSKLFERGLAYEAEVPVNWCPALGTVLANEEVIDGKSERGSHPVVRMPMKQWMLRITEYAERLIDDLDDLDWPEHIKRMQLEWIGRSEGARVAFPIEGSDGEIEVFTTRPDTLFGATYIVLAPEHPLVAEMTTEPQRAAVDAYVEGAARKSERVRTADTGEKTGVFTGGFAINPVNDERVPVWIADYVLSTYGTGAIMAVPAHDQRDWDFATRFEIPIVQVVDNGGDVSEGATTQPGVAMNSAFLDGLPTAEAKTRINAWLEEQGKGEATVSYKLRDWLFSRQRYWGEPFPVLHLEDGTTKLVPHDELPVLLPELDDWTPSGDFETPLSRVPEWIQTTDPATGAPARRDRNTMPQWAGSCWYFLRFCDPLNHDAAFSPEAEQYWMPVDLYVGGAEHAVLHLLYARFWHKVLYDAGFVHCKEPFQKLLNPGMILGYSYRYYDDNLEDDPAVSPNLYPSSAVRIEGERATAAANGDEVKARWVHHTEIRLDEDGTALHPDRDDIMLEEVTEKMSKSRGNVISPDEMIEEFGADAMRVYTLFMGPLDKGAPWSTEGIPGCFRFLQRSHRLFYEQNGETESLRTLPAGAGTDDQQRLTAATIAGVTEDMEAIQPNTAISKLMVFVRDIAKDSPLPQDAAEAFLIMLGCYAPHLAEELWSQLGHTGSVGLAAWPTYDEALLVSETITLAVQVNGKRRAEIEVPADADNDAVQAIALADEGVQRHVEGKAPRKVIVVPGRLVNIVV